MFTRAVDTIKAALKKGSLGVDVENVREVSKGNEGQGVFQLYSAEMKGGRPVTVFVAHGSTEESCEEVLRREGRVRRGTEHYHELTDGVKAALGAPAMLRGTLACAAEALGRIRTLRHPGILQYISSAAKGRDIAIVTAAATPLRHVLRERRVTVQEISAGVASLAGVLGWLHQCGLAYNNVTLDGIFVTAPPTRWVLGDFSFACPRTADDLCLHSMAFQGVIAPEDIFGTPAEDMEALQGRCDLASRDVYGLGVLIDELLVRAVHPGDADPSSVRLLELRGRLLNTLLHFFETERLQLSGVLSSSALNNPWRVRPEPHHLSLPVTEDHMGMQCLEVCGHYGEKLVALHKCIPGSVAEGIGLQAGWVLREVGGKCIETIAALQAVIHEAREQGMTHLDLLCEPLSHHTSTSSAKQTDTSNTVDMGSMSSSSSLNKAVRLEETSSSPQLREADDEVRASQFMRAAEGRGFDAVLEQLTDEIRWVKFDDLPHQLRLVGDSPLNTTVVDKMDKGSLAEYLLLWSLGAQHRSPLQRPSLRELLGRMPPNPLSEAAGFLSERKLMATRHEREEAYASILASIPAIPYPAFVDWLLPLLLDRDILVDATADTLMDSLLRPPPCPQHLHLTSSFKIEKRGGGLLHRFKLTRSSSLRIPSSSPPSPPPAPLPEPGELLTSQDYMQHVVPFISALLTDDSGDASLRVSILKRLPLFVSALDKPALLSDCLPCVSMCLYDLNDEICKAGCAAAPALVDALYPALRGVAVSPKEAASGLSAVQSSIITPLYALATVEGLPVAVKLAAVNSLVVLWSMGCVPWKGAIISGVSEALKDTSETVRCRVLADLAQAGPRLPSDDVAGLLVPILAFQARTSSGRVRQLAQGALEAALSRLGDTPIEGNLPTLDTIPEPPQCPPEPFQRRSQFRNNLGGWCLLASVVRKRRARQAGDGSCLSTPEALNL